MPDKKDFLEEMIDVWTEKDPSFRAAFEAAWRQREIAHKKPLDDLDEFIAERTAKNPAFPHLMEAARRQRLRLRKLAKRAREDRSDDRGAGHA